MNNEPVLFSGRPKIGKTLKVPYGYKIDHEPSYEMEFPKSKITMPSFWFHFVMDSSSRLKYWLLSPNTKAPWLTATMVFVPNSIHVVVETDTKFQKIVSMKKLYRIINYSSEFLQLIPLEISFGMNLDIFKNLKIPKSSSEPTLLKGFLDCDECKKIIHSGGLLNSHRWIRMLRPRLKQSHKFLEFLTDLILLDSVVGNISEIKFYGYYGNNEILLQSNETNGQLSLVQKTQEFRFLSCGQPPQEPINFFLYFLAFDSLTWIFIFVVFFIATTIVNVIVKGSFLDGAFYGLTILFDQGQSVMVNPKKIPSIYWITGAWILMTLILTNAYKGDNITKLVSPLVKIPYGNLSQLVRDNFSFISKGILIDNYDVSEYLPYGTGAPFEAEVEMWHGNITRLYLPGWYAFLRPMFLKMKEEGYIETVGILRNCSGQAYVGWSDELEIMSIELSVLNPLAKAKICTGKEIYSSRNVGWEVIVFHDQSIYPRLSVLYESGMSQRLQGLKVNAIKLFSIAEASKNNELEERDPKGANLEGNIKTIFFIMLVLLSIACVGYGLENLGRSCLWFVMKCKGKVGIFCKPRKFKNKLVELLSGKKKVGIQKRKIVSFQVSSME